MSSSKEFKQRSLIPAFALVVALFAWPEPASAQMCGECIDDLDENGLPVHHFKILGLWDRCDNTDGCHTEWTQPGLCAHYHHKCYLGPLPKIVVSAILEGNAVAFKEQLARVDGSDYDAMDRTLSLTCSDNTGSEYVLPEELAEVAAS